MKFIQFEIPALIFIFVRLISVRGTGPHPNRTEALLNSKDRTKMLKQLHVSKLNDELLSYEFLIPSILKISSSINCDRSYLIVNTI